MFSDGALLRGSVKILKEKGVVKAPRRPVQLTPKAVYLIGSATIFIIVGMVTSLPMLVALGGLPIALLTAGWAASRRLFASYPASATFTIQPIDPRRSQLRNRSEFRVVLGRSWTATVTCELSHPEVRRSAQIEPIVVAPTEARLEGSGLTRTLTMTPSRVGDAWLEGFDLTVEAALGLFVVTAFIPCTLRLKALPRHYPLRQQTPLVATRSSAQERAGATFTRRRGMSIEIRELRDHVPGDPFKHIAWSASARRGKLVSREFESDLMLSVMVLVDVSPSMFWGQPGNSRIDYAIDVAYNLLSAIVGGGFKAGLIVADHKVRLSVPVGSGRGHMPRLVEGLLEIPWLYYDDRTEITERELVESAADWFQRHLGQSLHLPDSLTSGHPLESGIDEARLMALARDRLAQQLAARVRKHAVIPIDSYAADAKSTVLRAFCRHSGITLPMDPNPRPGGQAAGLEGALQEVLATRGGPHTVLVISDLFSADDLSTLRRVALAARRRRHAMVMFCPWDEKFEHVSKMDRTAQAIFEVTRLKVEHNLQAAQAILRPAGVRFLRCGPDDVVPRLLARLRHVA